MSSVTKSEETLKKEILYCIYQINNMNSSLGLFQMPMDVIDFTNKNVNDLEHHFDTLKSILKYKIALANALPK